MSATDGLPLRTPLYERHVDLGATMTVFGGWEMPLRYGSELAEHRCVRDSAGMFDLSHMAELFVEGDEAPVALDTALVGDLSSLRVGRSRYTLACETDGGILDDLVVYRLTAAKFLVVANAANRDVVATALRDQTAERRSVVLDRTVELALVAVQGPGAAGVLEKLAPGSTADLASYEIGPRSVAGADVLVARTGYTGEDGFEIFCQASDAGVLWDRLACGAVVPAGLAARDTLRLEAGMALYGHELSRLTNPYEAGLGRLVALGKPAEFVGRSRLAALGAEPVQTRLVGLVTHERRVPRAGHEVVAPGSGEIVGRVTSGAPSPTLGHPIAMAYVAASLATPGTPLGIDVRGVVIPAVVVELPFYRRRP